MGWFILVIGALLIAMGVAIDRFKCYWLIAGYNTAGNEEKKNVDIEKLAKVIARLLYFIAFIILVTVIIEPYFPNVTLILPIALLGSIIGTIIYVQRFDHNKKSKGETVGFAVILAIPILISVIITAGSMEGNKVIVENNKVNIDVFSGITLSKDEIFKVTLEDSMPKVKGKKLGSSIGTYKKGLFNLDGGKVANIYLESNKGPYIKITSTKGDVYINFKDVEKTKSTYKEIEAM